MTGSHSSELPLPRKWHVAKRTTACERNFAPPRRPTCSRNITARLALPDGIHYSWRGNKTHLRLCYHRHDDSLCASSFFFQWLRQTPQGAAPIVETLPYPIVTFVWKLQQNKKGNDFVRQQQWQCVLLCYRLKVKDFLEKKGVQDKRERQGKEG